MKSHVSDLVEFAILVIKDAMAKCVTDNSFERDIKTLISRVEHEGISFLTITLPTFGQDFERCLDQESINPTLFRSFKKSEAIPAFLQGMLGLVFDKSTGRINENPDIAAIEGIRQIAYAFKKLKLPCSPERVSRAFSAFKNDELDLKSHVDSDSHRNFVSVANILWGSIFGDFNSLDAIPKHGPGSTADKLLGNQKFKVRTWHNRLEPYFPLLHFVFSSENAYGSEGFKKVSIVDEERELPVRVITVPKTLKSPRIIAIEPTCMQYTQQAIAAYLIDKLQVSPLTKGHINFSDQSINRVLSLQASKDRSLATLDLSSASDRVPLYLVADMFGKDSLIYESLYACRSKVAKLPSGDIIPLEKFASMGSALCFPVESMYFYTICVAALLEFHSLPVTYWNIKKVSRDVYIYGDDIFVPTDAVNSTIEHLQKYHCKVNMSKSFWRGNFRESCGMDAFNGEEVTPTYLREMLPNSRQNGAALVSTVATSNLLWKKGYWLSSSFLKKKVEKVLGPLPIILPTSAALGWVTFLPGYQIDKIGGRYQEPRVRSWVARPVYRKDKLDGYQALMKCLLRLEKWQYGQTSDKKHLHRSVRNGAVALQRRWTRPY